ncbi:hypothetical protein JCM30760_27030 [Thiomicrorhabdus hydrogeniphila]
MNNFIFTDSAEQSIMMVDYENNCHDDLIRRSLSILRKMEAIEAVQSVVPSDYFITDFSLGMAFGHNGIILAENGSIRIVLREINDTRMALGVVIPSHLKVSNSLENDLNNLFSVILNEITKSGFTVTHGTSESLKTA